MGDPDRMPDDPGSSSLAKRISEALRDVVSNVPTSHETALGAGGRALKLGHDAALKAALISGGMAIVPGPVGILTIIPALIKIWKIQQQMVADIAACYGKSAQLNSQMMLYCLFRHGSATIFKETVVQIGGRLLARQATLQTVQHLIQKISVNVTQRILGQFFSRWLPLAGSAAMGTFTFWDTKRIARTAIATFEKEIEFEAPELAGPENLPPLPPA